MFGPQKGVEADIRPSTYRHVRKGGVIGKFSRSTGPVVPAQQFWRSITGNFRNPAAMTAKSESRSSSRRPVNRSAIRRSMTRPARALSRRLSELCKPSQRLQTSPKRSAQSSSSVRASLMQTITLSSFGRLQIRRTEAPTKRVDYGFSVETQP
ncbi:unnamed protein product [Musa acuminata var. zebrina]